MTATFVIFGAFDSRKPRVRLLINALRRKDAVEREIRISGWESIAQTNVPSKFALLGIALRMILAFPVALIKLIGSPKSTAILLPYPGIIEIFLIAPFAKLMRRTIVLDMFLPLYDTIVVDRALVKPGFVAKAVWYLERTALKLADIVLVDTDNHGEYFAREFGIERAKFETVLVGAEPHFSPLAAAETVDDILGPPDDRSIVLFYGQLIPLHGLPTIIDAAQLCRHPNARWVVIGKGQLEPLMIKATADAGSASIEWIEWVNYERLPAVIARADVCLGVFGGSDKAARVIPNKLFQQLAVGKPVITRESPAVHQLASSAPAAVRTVPPEDPQALADAVRHILDELHTMAALSANQLAELGPDAGVTRLLDRLSDQTGNRS